MKTFYVISYDVVNDRKREKISKILEGYEKECNTVCLKASWPDQIL